MGFKRRPAKRLFFIEYYDAKHSMSMMKDAFFTEDDYSVALELLKHDDEFEISDHGEFKPEEPKPVNLSVWKKSLGLDDDA